MPKFVSMVIIERSLNNFNSRLLIRDDERKADKDYSNFNKYKVEDIQNFTNNN